MNKKIFEYLFLLLHSKLTNNFLIEIIRNLRFKFITPTIILKRNPIYFDTKWYRKTYDIPNDVNPIKHYLEIGFKKGYNPHPNFDTNFYLNEYLDINGDINPFIHYLRRGINENNLPKIFTLSEIKQLNLKTTLMGKSQYLFLVNDTNNELLQHYDKNYENKFDKDLFLKDYYFKKSLFNENGINYAFYAVPDKSLVCTNLLPFKVEEKICNLDNVDEINNFYDDLTPEDYFKGDSHMNFQGGKKLAFSILNHLDNSFDWEIFENILSNYSTDEEIIREYDLVANLNWSYTLLERQSFIKKGVERCPRPTNLTFLHDVIPEDFRLCNKRLSEYFKNTNSFSDLRVLIFHDSSTEFLRYYFTFYFRETFLFWDHGTMNKDLIEWFNPDLILEIRIERFIDDLHRPKWIINKEKINIK